MIINAFFEAHEEYRYSDDMRQDFARHSLATLRFIYRKANGTDKRVSIFPHTTKLVEPRTLEIQRPVPR